MNNLPMQLAKRLYFKFSSIYGDRFLKKTHSDEFIEIWIEEWALGLEDIDPSLIKLAIDFCRKNEDFPPSIARFRKICIECSGIVSPEEIMRLAIRRELDDPVVEYVFSRVGSWNFSHFSTDELLREVKNFRQEYLNGVSQNKLGNSSVNAPKLEVVG